MFCKRLLARLTRPIHTSAITAAKPKGAKVLQMKAPLPVTDANLLTTRCCGLNKFKGGEDPELKPDSEYPEWLWRIPLGKKRHYKQMDPRTKEYWISLQRQKLFMQNLPKKRRKFNYRPRSHQLSFQSRLSPKLSQVNEKE